MNVRSVAITLAPCALSLLVSFSPACARGSVKARGESRKAAAPPDWLQVSDNRPSIESVSRVSLDVAIQQRRLAYRVRPDARFLAAMGYVHRCFTGRPTASIRLTYELGSLEIAG